MTLFAVYVGYPRASVAMEIIRVELAQLEDEALPGGRLEAAADD